MPSWHTIDIAPKDEAWELILYVPHDRMVPPGSYTIQFGGWNKARQCWHMIDQSSGGYVDCEPTHWMIAPTRPE